MASRNSSLRRRMQWTSRDDELMRLA